MHVRDAMTKDVEPVSQETSVIDAARTMSDRNVGSLLVVDGERLVGIVTDRDLVLRVLAENRSPLATPLGEVMSVEVACCHPEQSLEEAKALMHEHQVGRLPVVDRKYALIGVITRRQVGLDDPSDKTATKVTFQKSKTDSYGRPHKVPVKTVYITGAKEKDTAVARAVEKLEKEQGRDWRSAADDMEVVENAPAHREE